MENARAPMIGALEKRQGQSEIGTGMDQYGYAYGNYGLVYYEDGGTLSQGLLRVTSFDGQSASLYYLDVNDVWTSVDNDLVMEMSLAICDTAKVDNSLIIVNGTDPNIMINGPITLSTSISNSSTPGSMFNSPSASKIAVYKSRIYLANYYSSGEQLKTTVLRSSYSMGLVSLVNGDPVDDQATVLVIPLVDTKYIYADVGMNNYDVYRGNEKVASLNISAMSETSVTVPKVNITWETGYSTILASDEFWIGGTYSGPKQYRWISNASTAGRNVKQYDTFRLIGGDEDEILLMEPIGNILLIANKNAIMSWNDFTLENFDIGVGCCSKNGYVKLKGSLYFMHYSGVFSTSGAVPQLLSRKIERYIRGATKAGIEACAAGYKGLSVFFSIGDVTLYNNDGSVWKVLSDVCLEYNVADQNWFVHTNVTATQFETYLESSGNEKLTMTAVTPAENHITGDELMLNGSFLGDDADWTPDPEWYYSTDSMTLSLP